MSNFKKLIDQLLLASSDNTAEFTQARNEWELINVEKDDNWNQCLCGKDIKELCYIRNKLNEKVLIVGNECIKKICPSGSYSTQTKQLFASIKKLSKTGVLSKLLIEYCKEKGIINDWEYEFSLSTHFKKQLSDKQKARKEIIDTKILKAVSKNFNIKERESKMMKEFNKLVGFKSSALKPKIKFKY